MAFSLRNLFRREPKTPGFTPTEAQIKAYQNVVAVGGQNSDWALSILGEDADVWTNIFTLRNRMRDLYRTNPIFIAYREQLFTNVFGDAGMKLRMRIKEEEDRVIYAPDEKWQLVAHQRRINRVLDRVRGQYKALHGVDIPNYRCVEEDSRGHATVKVGDPDLYACKIIEEGWAEWKRREFCDVRGTRDYPSLCNIRLLSAARDGEMFIQHIRDPKVNKFGYAIRCVNAEWCDQYYNTILPNGNTVRMGIEYQWNDNWGIGRPVAYYFLKRQKGDWQYTVPGLFQGVGDMHDRVPANEILHYARYTDNDSTRPAPWGVSVIPNSRQLNKYEEAEVIAARVAACKMGWLYSDTQPEGGYSGEMPDPRQSRIQAAEPGGFQALPYGVKFQGFDPNHPNGNFENFRKAMLRSWCAGMPGATYSTLASDYENINFSAGRLERLSITELYRILQQFDISAAEVPVFENWLQMALLTKAVPLPAAKFKKYNRPVIQGRRWPGVDPVKEQTAAAMAIANKLTTRSRVCAEQGEDFDDVLLELAEEEAQIAMYGMSPATTAETPAVQSEDNEGDNGADDDENDDGEAPSASAAKPKKPKPKTPKGKAAELKPAEAV